LNYVKAPLDPKNYLYENVCCYECMQDTTEEFLTGQDDLTGKPGDFKYVKCTNCGLVYQNPRLQIETVKDFYDDDYIAYKRTKDFGILTKFYNWAMSKHDRDKETLVKKYIIINAKSEVLDIGCAVGSFLLHLKDKFNCNVSGVDFKNHQQVEGFSELKFYQGLFYEQDFNNKKYDCITMWHFLEHDYEPVKTLNCAKEILKDDGRLIIEVPRLDSLSFKLFKERWPGVQAPQHTVLFDKHHFEKFINNSGLEIVEYLPYGAFPAYFYFFTGWIFKLLKGKGLDTKKYMAPYFIGQILTLPFFMFEKHLNLSMQTIVCKKKKE
jgi:2-polyprenyl-3-methyl-5-hydroxy-6-metoxy-1,4-benzoquinol methylase